MAKEDTEVKVFPVYAPTLGIIRNIPSTMLDPRACTNCSNIRLKGGVVSKRTGYGASYATGAITGVPIGIFRYQQWDGTEYEILCTTTNVYYNDAGAWTSLAGSLNATTTFRASVASIENYMVYTNGVDAASKCLATTWSALDAGAENWSLYRPLIFLPYRFRLLGFNDQKSGAVTAIRIMYSKLGDFDAIDGTESSGFIDMTQGMGSKIVGAAPMKNYIAMYKDYSCALLDYIGGSSIFGIDVHIQGIGLAAKDAIVNLGTSHLFLGSDLNFHEWNGGWELNHIGDSIKDLLRAEIDETKLAQCFAVTNYAETEAHFFIVVTGQTYPTVFYTYNWTDRSWVRNTIAAMSTAGEIAKAGVTRTLLALATGTVHHYDYSTSTLTDNGAAITSSFETPDFVLDKEEHLARHRRFYGVVFDIKGSSASAKVTLNYSGDEGSSWDSEDKKLTLTASYAHTKWDFLQTQRRLRLRFSDTTSGQTPYIRFYGLLQKEGERG